MSANSYYHYRGKLRSYLSYPRTGSLQDIQVQVDENGKHDDRVQALRAKLRGFTIKLAN